MRRSCVGFLAGAQPKLCHGSDGLLSGLHDWKRVGGAGGLLVTVLLLLLTPAGTLAFLLTLMAIDDFDNVKLTFDALNCEAKPESSVSRFDLANFGCWGITATVS
jgi:hypothetical protein